MIPINTEKKLQIIRQLREDSLHNQMNTREMTSLLNGAKPEQKHHFSSFRLRFFLAVVLLIIALYFTTTNQYIYGKPISDYFHYLTINQAEDILKQHGF